ncbi:MAG: translation elongation factor 4 [bacterium]|nr:translation elongation factor 4 [bacterium]
MESSSIRNFCIIAHIDHGKSTLADRMLELTGTVSSRDMKQQTLDQMDLEQERGITIKLAPVRMRWTLGAHGGTMRTPTPPRPSSLRAPADADEREVGDHQEEYIFHLIDTPGHVDFTYEVSRSLAAVEGAILLVDATQGVQAQTIANLYLAMEQDLVIIPAINKIDLPAADVERTAQEIMELLGCAREEILAVSGKTGEGVAMLLDAVVERVPAPVRTPPPQDEVGDRRLRALIFDSVYDDFRGVIAYVRVVDGSVARGDKLKFFTTGTVVEASEVGSFNPKLYATDEVGPGEIGYIVTGLKDIRSVRVGDTMTGAKYAATAPLPGYKDVRPMVFAGVFPKNSDETEQLRDAIDQLRLNDAALVAEPEHSQALGVGFRCGFLGLLHLDVFRERLIREHNMDVVVTVPSVAYWVRRQHQADSSAREVIRSPQELPDPSSIAAIEEPWVRMDIVTPEQYVGGLMQLCQEYRGTYRTTEYLAGGIEGQRRALLKYELPLAKVLVDFYDRLKSVSQGYASMNYEISEHREANVRRLDIFVVDEPEESLATIVYEDEAQQVGRRIVERLKDVIPRHQFEVRIQAAIGGKIVASARISPLRKDVTAGLYGGDVTRKKKLLEKQKKGKKAMRATGRVDLPPEAYIAVLKR